MGEADHLMALLLRPRAPSDKVHVFDDQEPAGGEILQKLAVPINSQRFDYSVNELFL